MEADVRQSRLFEQDLQPLIGRGGRHRQFRAGGVGEDPLADGPLLSLPEELHDAPGQDDGAGTLTGLGDTQSEHAHLLAVQGAAHIKGAFLFVEVLPHQAADLAPAQAGHELGVEEVIPDLILADGLHKGVQLLLVQDAHGFVVGSRCRRPLGRVPGDDMSLHRVLHGTVERIVDVAYCGV